MSEIGILYAELNVAMAPKRGRYGWVQLIRVEGKMRHVISPETQVASRAEAEKIARDHGATLRQSEG